MKRTSLLISAVTLLILLLSNLTFASSITIDATTGTWDDGGTLKIIPNCEVTFDLRYHNNSGSMLRGMSNSFHVISSSPLNQLTGEFIYPGLDDYFDLVTSISIIGDTITIGGSAFPGAGLPDGFNEAIVRIKTGGVPEGETLCFDSVSYAQNAWKWVNVSGDIVPDWSGNRCFLAELAPCIPPTIANCIDTIKNDCEQISYDFDDDGMTFGHSFFIVEGPGTINSSTGEWSYTIPPEETGLTDTLVVAVSRGCQCNYNSCSTILKYGLIDPSADFTGDCSSDISDLVFLVEFIFLNGPAPVPLLVADLNGDIEVDISDLVKMVEYIFGSSSL